MGLLCCAVTAPAQELDPIRNAKNIDLSQITDAFTRNMSLLDQALSGAMHNEEVHQMMLVVMDKAVDVSKFYRSGGGADKRRKLLEQLEAQKKKGGFSKADKARLDDLNQQVRDADPSGIFGQARGDFGKATGELQRLLGLYQTADTTTMDIIRLIQEHLSFYQNAMGKYQ